MTKEQQWAIGVSSAQGQYMKDHGCNLISGIAKVKGDICEFGCFQGFVCRTIAEIWPNRTVYAFDTFEGMPEQDHTEALDSLNPPGKWKSDKAETIERLSGLKNLVPVVGRFHETLRPNTEYVLPDQVAFAHIDSDTYESHKRVLAWLEPRLQNGAIIMFDDWGNLRGVNKAVKEWLAHVGSKFIWQGEKHGVWNA